MIYYKDMNMNRWERIREILLVYWIIHLIILIVSVSFLHPPSPTPIWFREFMWIGFISWILIILPLTLLYGFTLSTKFKRQKLTSILNMEDNEIINNLKHKNYNYYRSLSKINHDNQIVAKVRESANELL